MKVLDRWQHAYWFILPYQFFIVVLFIIYYTTNELYMSTLSIKLLCKASAKLSMYDSTSVTTEGGRKSATKPFQQQESIVQTFGT